MSEYNPKEQFKEFYESDFVQMAKDKEKWTVSKDKVPVDMWGYILEHRVYGALYNDGTSLVTLDRLLKEVPSYPNNAYYLDALDDNFVVLDIEPKCPDDIKAMLLKTPYLYGEVSMSGKGYHLIFALPACFSEYPIAQIKKTMTEKHGYYEILLNHYVTFTRQAIPPSNGETDFEQIFRELASEQKESVARTDIDLDIDPDEIPLRDDIIQLLEKQKYKKTIEDFRDRMGNGSSEFEFGYMGFLHFKLKQILNITYIKKQHAYSDGEKAWLLYEVAQHVIPYRAKHDETRYKMPWLLFLAHDVIAKHVDHKKEKI